MNPVEAVVNFMSANSYANNCIKAPVSLKPEVEVFVF
jgi:hypothetical protein